MRCDWAPVSLEGWVFVSELIKVEFELDEKCHGALCSEAERLGLTTSEVARRAVSAWLCDMAENTTGLNGASAEA